jgi:hypothetical protein
VFDEGLGIFAGLNVIPKRSFLGNWKKIQYRCILSLRLSL